MRLALLNDVLKCFCNRVNDVTLKYVDRVLCAFGVENDEAELQNMTHKSDADKATWNLQQRDILKNVKIFFSRLHLSLVRRSRF